MSIISMNDSHERKHFMEIVFETSQMERRKVVTIWEGA
jgi:hypothetical protein